MTNSFSTGTNIREPRDAIRESDSGHISLVGTQEVAIFPFYIPIIQLRGRIDTGYTSTNPRTRRTWIAKCPGGSPVDEYAESSEYEVTSIHFVNDGSLREPSSGMRFSSLLTPGKWYYLHVQNVGGSDEDSPFIAIWSMQKTGEQSSDWDPNHGEGSRVPWLPIKLGSERGRSTDTLTLQTGQTHTWKIVLQRNQALDILFEWILTEGAPDLGFNYEQWIAESPTGQPGTMKNVNGSAAVGTRGVRVMTSPDPVPGTKYISNFNNGNFVLIEPGKEYFIRLAVPEERAEARGVRLGAYIYGENASTNMEGGRNGGVNDRDIPNLPTIVYSGRGIEPPAQTTELFRGAQYTWKFQLSVGELLRFVVSHIPRPGTPAGNRVSFTPWVSATPGGPPLEYSDGSSAKATALNISTTPNISEFSVFSHNWQSVNYALIDPNRTYYVNVDIPGETHQSYDIALYGTIFKK